MIRTSMLVLSAVIALPATVSAFVVSPVPIVAIGDSMTADGSIKSVDAINSSFLLSTGSGTEVKDVTVKVNQDTKYTLDGKDSTMERAIVAGNRAKVTHKDQLASRVDATTVKTP